MSDKIKTYVNFAAIPVGATQTLPHTLEMNGRPVAPDHVELELPRDFQFVSSDATGIEIRNVQNPSGNCRALLEAWHPIERVFGLDPDDGTFTQHLTPQPFAVQWQATTGGIPFTPSLTIIFARTTGSDTTGNGTLLTPYRTFQRAILDVPSLAGPGAEFIVDVTDLGIETFPLNYVAPIAQFASIQEPLLGNADRPWARQPALRVRATPMLTPVIPALDAVITDAMTPVTATVGPGLMTLSVAGGFGLSWGAALIGKQVIRSAGALFQASPAVIYGASPGVLLLCNTVAQFGALNAQTVIQIVEPSATFQAPPGTSVDGGAIRFMNVSSLSLQGIRVQSTVPGSPALNISNIIQPTLEICDIDGLISGGVPIQFSLFATTVRSRAQALDSSMNPTRSLFTGVTSWNLLGTTQIFRQCVFLDCAPLQNPSFAGVIEQTPTWGFANVLVDSPVTTAGISAGIYCTGGRWTFNTVQIDNAPTANGHGIFAERGPNYLSLLAVKGSGNGGVGVKANDGAFVQITDPFVTGTGDSFAVALGVVTLTDAGAFTAGMVGQQITISGSTTPANDGTFVVASFVSANAITFANGAGVAEVFPGTWTVSPALVTGSAPGVNDLQSGILPVRSWADFFAVAPVGNEYDLVGMNAGASTSSTGTRIFQRP